MSARIARLLASVTIVCVLPATISRADSVYTDHAAWLSALGGRTVHDASFSPQPVPATLTTIPGDPIALTFDRNSGDLTVYEDGWRGEVTIGNFSDFNLVTFDKPVLAFGGWFAVSGDDDPATDSILLDFGSTTSTFRLTREHYPWDTRTFFGWVGSGSGTSQIRITSEWFNYYEVRDVQYVTAPPTPGNDGDALAVPLPTAAWGGLMMFGFLGAARWRRARRG